MLVLTRKVGESIRIGHNIELTILEVKGEAVRVGITAPNEIGIYRQEIYDLIQEQNRSASQSEFIDLLKKLKIRSEE